MGIIAPTLFISLWSYLLKEAISLYNYVVHIHSGRRTPHSKNYKYYSKLMPPQFPHRAFPEEVIGNGMTTACVKELVTMTVGFY